MNEQLLIETTNMIEPKMYINGHYMVAHKGDIFVNPIYKMAAATGLGFNIGCYGRIK